MAPKPRTDPEPRVAYRVLVGLNYPAAGLDKRAEADDIVEDLPAKSVPWLLQDGYIEPVED